MPIALQVLQETWRLELVRLARLGASAEQRTFAPRRPAVVPEQWGLILVTALCVLALAYVPECALAWAKGWYLSPRTIPAMMVRDVMLPAIWARGWLGGAVDWRGNAMTIRTKAMTELEEGA